METTPVPVQPKPNFSSMSYLVGTWTCSTKSARRPSAYTSTTTYTMSPDGYWLEGTTITNPMAWFPHKTTNYDKITYDAATNRWVDLSYGEFGGYDMTVANGWSGDSMVWHDLAFAAGPDVKSTTDVTMKKVSDMKVVYTSSFGEASGRSVGVVSTCTKSS